MQRDLAAARPDLVNQAIMLLDKWEQDMLGRATHAEDPMRTVLLAGGPDLSQPFFGVSGVPTSVTYFQWPSGWRRQTVV